MNGARELTQGLLVAKPANKKGRADNGGGDGSSPRVRLNYGIPWLYK